jgi:hypothetical protein
MDHVNIQVYYMFFSTAYLLNINNTLIILAGNSCKILYDATDGGAMRTKMGMS